jgi:integrase
MLLFIAIGMDEIDLKAATRVEYTRQIHNRLMHHFGHLILNTLDSSTVAHYLVMRRKGGAAKGGNRERATLSSAISWGMGLGYCDSNPCLGVRRNKETPSKVYVADDMLDDAVARAPPSLQNLLMVAYLTGLRQGDLRALQRSNITEQGIRLTQSKDGKDRLVEWSPELRRDRIAARNDPDIRGSGRIRHAHVKPGRREGRRATRCHGEVGLARR